MDYVHSALSQAGCPDNIAEIAIETLQQAGLLIHSGEHIRAGAADVQGNLRIPEPPERQEEHFPSGTHLVALLSLFDGTGLARIAVEEAINDCEGTVLVRSVFVEHDRTLARQVATGGSNEVNNGRTRVAHTPIACDIWDLCRPEHSPLGTATNGTSAQADCHPAKQVRTISTCGMYHHHSRRVSMPAAHVRGQMQRTTRAMWTRLCTFLCSTHGGLDPTGAKTRHNRTRRAGKRCKHATRSQSDDHASTRGAKYE